MNGCVFCKIVTKEMPATIQFEDEKVIAFESIDPVAELHILIVPKKHIPTFTDIRVADFDVLGSMIKASQKLITDKNIKDGYKLIFNGGKYQSVAHLHWHLLGGELKKAAIEKT